MIVLGFFNQWVATVGHANADTDRRYLFAMGSVGWDEAEKRPREIFATNGTSEQIMSDLRDASAVMAVNITDILSRLRERARIAEIDLWQPFFFPPEHERFSQIIVEFEHERASRVSDAVRKSGGGTRYSCGIKTLSRYRD